MARKKSSKGKAKKDAMPKTGAENSIERKNVDELDMNWTPAELDKAEDRSDNEAPEDVDGEADENGEKEEEEKKEDEKETDGRGDGNGDEETLSSEAQAPVPGEIAQDRGEEVEDTRESDKEDVGAEEEDKEQREEKAEGDGEGDGEGDSEREGEEEKDEEEHNDSTANRFVIVDSEDEEEFEKEDILQNEKIKDDVIEKSTVKPESDSLLNKPTEPEAKSASEELPESPSIVITPQEEPRETPLMTTEDTKMEKESKVEIGQQPYDPEGGQIASHESRSSAEPRDLAFITPTPLYRYIENKETRDKMKSLTSNFVFGLAVVDFDHIKGPELTYWLDDEVISAQDEGQSDKSIQGLLQQKIRHYSKIWPYLAFQALPDGVHMYGETFTQFTLCYDELKKTDVELDFDLVDLVFDDEAPKAKTGIGAKVEQSDVGAGADAEAEADADVSVKTETDANGNFVNVDFTKTEQATGDETSLEKSRTRPVVEMEDPNQGVITLFGCACIRQLDTALLKNIDKTHLKRSVVQKSVILLTRSPLPIQLREKLSIITQSWFEQRDFSDREILKALYVHVSSTYNQNGYLIEDDDLYEVNNNNNSNSTVEDSCKIIKESDFYMGLNFQEVVRKLRRQLLVIFKCLVLGKSRILFFSKDLNALSNTQYCLIGLISNLLLNLSDSGYPLSDNFLHEEKMTSQSLKSSDRASILRFLGLPLRIFGFGSFFQPYLTLQQLSYITNINTKSFVVGSSNDIILEHKKDWFDVIIHLDEKESGLFGSGGCKVEILNKSLKDKVGLTWDDKKFIDYIIHSVDTHYLQDAKERPEEQEGEEKEKADEEKHDAGSATTATTSSAAGSGEHRSTREQIKSKTVNSNLSIDNGVYKGGDDFIRSQFEDYLIGFLSCVKYDDFLRRQATREKEKEVVEQLRLDTFDNDIARFGARWVEEFRRSQVYEHWNEITENELFNFFEPRHVGKDIGKDDAAEYQFKGGEVFKSWISRWKEAGRSPAPSPGPGSGAGDAETGKVAHPDSADRGDKRDKGDKGGAGEGADKAHEGRGADPAAAAAATVKTTMNTFGRDVGLFFRKIGDNTSQRLYSSNPSTDKDAPAEEHKQPEDVPARAKPCVEADAAERGNAADTEGAPGSGLESRLRGLFQWGK